MKRKAHLNTRNPWFQKGEMDGHAGTRRTLPEGMTDWSLEMYEKGCVAGRLQRIETPPPSSGHTAPLLSKKGAS